VNLRGDGLAALSGVLLALSFPKFGHWAVAWVALVPLLVALATSAGAHAFRLGYVTGAISSIGILYWTSFVVVRYGGLSLPVGVAVMTLLAMAVALFPSLFAWTLGRGLATFGPMALLFAPPVWVATELLRNRTFFRFPWCLLGYSQQPSALFIQTARFGAVYAVSFLVAGVASVLAYLLVEKRTTHRRRAVTGLALVLGLVMADGARQLSREVPEAGRERVALVQARILQEEKWDEARAIVNVAEHRDLTRRAVESAARFVVWPESSVPDFFDEGPPVARDLRALARDAKLHLLFGNDDREDDGKGGVRVFVGAKMLSPEGDLAYRYHKIRLVPFGEYVPMQPILTLGGRVAAKLVQQVADFTPGSDLALAPVDGHPAGAFICYEAIFPELVRGFAAGGAEMLVNLTHDAWYGRTSAPHQHLAMAAFRAVENGKYLVRAANTGITAVIDPRGRILEQTPLFERTVLVRDVPWVRGQTFYARHGDVFAWVCFAAAAALVVATFTARTRRVAE
jgi:apolipoprotein N-acyltransferase